MRFKNKFVENRPSHVTPTEAMNNGSEAAKSEDYRMEDMESYEHLSKHYTGGRKPRTQSEMGSNHLINPVESFEDAGESIEDPEEQELN